MFLQMEAVECGAAALGSVLAYHRKYVPLEELRLECGVTRDGVKASNILKAAARYGLEVTATASRWIRSIPYRRRASSTGTSITSSSTRGEGKAAGFTSTTPRMGHRIVSAERFDKEFTGVALGLTPGEELRAHGEAVLVSRDVPPVDQGLARRHQSARPHRHSPRGARARAPRAHAGRRGRRADPRDVALAHAAAPRPVAVGVTRFALEATKRYLLGRLQERIGMRAAADFIWRLLHLPMRFFTQRSAGELASRLLVYDVATGFFSKEAPDAVLDVLVVGFYVALMCAYNVPLALIAVCAATLSILVFYFFASRLETEEAVMQQERGKGMSFLVQALSMIETIKLRADESDVLQKTMDHSARDRHRRAELLLVHATSTLRRRSS